MVSITMYEASRRMTNLSKRGIGAGDERPVSFGLPMRSTEVLGGLEVLPVCGLNSVWPIFNETCPGISIDSNSASD
jgi:hypothetical protein